MGDPMYEESALKADEAYICGVEITRTSSNKPPLTDDEPLVSLNLSTETNILPDAGHVKKEEENTLSKSTAIISDGESEDDNDAGSINQNDSLHSFLSGLFEETASKREILDDSDEWGNEKDESAQQEQNTQNHKQSEVLEHQQFQTNQIGESSPQFLAQKDDTKVPQEQVASALASNVERPFLVNQLKSQSSLHLSDISREQERHLYPKKSSANRTEESLAMDHSKNQASLELKEVFGFSLVSTNVDHVSLLRTDSIDRSLSSSAERSQSISKTGCNSQVQSRKLNPLQKKVVKKSASVHSNKKENDSNNERFHTSDQMKASPVRRNPDIVMSQSRQNNSGLMSSKHVNNSTSFSKDNRIIKTRIPKTRNKVSQKVQHPNKRLEVAGSTGTDLPANDAPLAAESNQIDQISHFVRKKECSNSVNKETGKITGTILHRRDELKESIIQSLRESDESAKEKLDCIAHKGNNKEEYIAQKLNRGSLTKMASFHGSEVLQALGKPFHKVTRRKDTSDPLATSTHSQASYFSSLKAPKRVTAAAESIMKLVGVTKAKDTTQLGAKLEPKIETRKTACAKVLVPNDAASFEVNKKGTNHKCDPPADESNVEPCVKKSNGHADRDDCDDHECNRATASMLEDRRSRKCTPHRQRGSLREDQSQKISPLRRLKSSDGRNTQQLSVSEEKCESETARLQSKTVPSSRHHNNKDKTVTSVRPTRSRSFRRQRDTESNRSQGNTNMDDVTQYSVRSRSRRRDCESQTKNEDVMNHDLSCERVGDEDRHRNSDEQSLLSKSCSKDYANAVTRHRSRSRRRTDDGSTIVSSRSRSSRSLGRARDLDEQTSHRTRRRGRSLRRSDPPGVAIDYEEEDKGWENLTDPEAHVREYKCRAKSNGPRRKRRPQIAKY